LTRHGRGLSPLEAASKIIVGNAQARREALPPEPNVPDRRQANLANGGAYNEYSTRNKIKLVNSGNMAKRRKTRCLRLSVIPHR
jgi:hypothetical protein